MDYVLAGIMLILMFWTAIRICVEGTRPTKRRLNETRQS